MSRISIQDRADQMDQMQKWLKVYVGQPNIKGLEIGSHEGGSAYFLMNNILTHKTSTLICVDPWLRHPEAETVFRIKMEKFAGRVTGIRSNSFDWLIKQPISPTFDFIFIDGDHTASAILDDAILCLRLLQKTGILIFDDYLWQPKFKTTISPKIAIDAFLSCQNNLLVSFACRQAAVSFK